MHARHPQWGRSWSLGNAIGIFTFFVVAASISFTFSAEPAPPGKCNYERPFEPPTRPALIPLPPGAIEPQGWLRDWCITAKDGYTGHMDDVDPAFRQAWSTEYKMTGDKLSSWVLGAWPYEGGGYWFDGLVRLGYVLHDDALINQAKSRLNVIVDNMNPNSIVFLWWVDKNKPEDLKAAEGRSAPEPEWPMWASGLMGRTMVGYYAGSADNRVLKTLETAYSGSPDWVGLGWSMSNVWPAFQTYTWTGNKEIKEALTALFTKEGDDKKPWSWNHYRRPPSDKPGAEPADHGVHFCECTAPWALGYLWTGKREFLDAALQWHDKIERELMQPHGVPVFDEFYGPTGAFRGSETCDIAGYMWSNTLLLSISGQGKLADRIERAFFNAAPAAIGRDFKSHAYFQSPNRMADKSLPAAGQFSFQAKHNPLCCTASLNRILPNYVSNMWMATRDNGLAAVCYGPCKVSALVADRVPVEIVCKTDYPFNMQINMTVNPQREAKFPLLLRIPSWAHYFDLYVNREFVREWYDANGFVRIKRLWKPGDKIYLKFRTFPHIATGRDANAGDAPYASVSYGPLLFALPIADTKDANTPDPAAKWQFAFDAQEAYESPDLNVESGLMPDKWNWPLESPLKLRVRAASIDWKPTLKEPLPSKPFDGGATPEWMTLVPYGCTKFRVSMFPVTKWAIETPEPPKESEGWGPERDGLRTRLLPAQKEYFVGRMARFRLEMKNFGKSDVEYNPHCGDVTSFLEVFDSTGKPVQYIGDTARMEGSRRGSLAPGKTVIVFEEPDSKGFDLNDQFLLLKPGSYKVRFRVKDEGHDELPPSEAIAFEMRPGTPTVSAQIAARMLEIVPKEADLNLHGRTRDNRVYPPGWKSGLGTEVTLEPGLKDKGEYWWEVTVWVAEQQLAPSEKEEPRSDEKPEKAAVYAGKGAYGHVYWNIPEEAQAKWPDIQAKVKAALQIENPAPAGP